MPIHGKYVSGGGGGSGVGALILGPAPNEFATTALRDAAAAGIETVGAAYGTWTVAGARPNTGQIQINESLREVAISVIDSGGNSHLALIDAGANSTIIGRKIRVQVSATRHLEFTITSFQIGGNSLNNVAYSVFNTSDMVETGATIAVNTNVTIHPITTSGGASWLAEYDSNAEFAVIVTNPNPDDAYVRRAGSWVEVVGSLLRGQLTNPQNADIDARIASYARAFNPSGTIGDAFIPAAIMRDAELTAARILGVLSLTQAQLNSIFVGATIASNVVTYNNLDGTTDTLTLPTTGGGSNDGVITAFAFNAAANEITITISTGSTITVPVPAVLRQSAGATLGARVESTFQGFNTWFVSNPTNRPTFLLFNATFTHVPHSGIREIGGAAITNTFAGDLYYYLVSAGRYERLGNVSRTSGETNNLPDPPDAAAEDKQYNLQVETDGTESWVEDTGGTGPVQGSAARTRVGFLDSVTTDAGAPRLITLTEDIVANSNYQMEIHDDSNGMTNTTKEIPGEAILSRSLATGIPTSYENVLISSVLTTRFNDTALGSNSVSRWNVLRGRSNRELFLVNANADDGAVTIEVWKYPRSVGERGEPGPPNPNGVPPGGAITQVLGKASAGDYDTAWIDQTGGGGAGNSRGDKIATSSVLPTAAKPLNNDFSAAAPPAGDGFLWTKNTTSTQVGIFNSNRIVFSRRARPSADVPPLGLWVVAKVGTTETDETFIPWNITESVATARKILRFSNDSDRINVVADLRNGNNPNGFMGDVLAVRLQGKGETLPANCTVEVYWAVATGPKGDPGDASSLNLPVAPDNTMFVRRYHLSVPAGMGSAQWVESTSEDMPIVTARGGLSDDNVPTAAELSIDGGTNGEFMLPAYVSKHILVARLASEGDITSIRFSDSPSANEFAGFTKHASSINVGGQAYSVWVSTGQFTKTEAVGVMIG